MAFIVDVSGKEVRLPITEVEELHDDKGRVLSGFYNTPCDHKRTITIRRNYVDMEYQPRSEDVLWCRDCGSLYEWDWEDGVRSPRWIPPLRSVGQ